MIIYVYYVDYIYVSCEFICCLVNNMWNSVKDNKLGSFHETDVVGQCMTSSIDCVVIYGTLSYSNDWGHLISVLSSHQ